MMMKQTVLEPLPKVLRVAMGFVPMALGGVILLGAKPGTGNAIGGIAFILAGLAISCYSLFSKPKEAL